MQNIHIIGMSIILNTRDFTHLQVTLSYLCFVVENQCEISGSHSGFTEDVILGLNLFIVNLQYEFSQLLTEHIL